MHYFFTNLACHYSQLQDATRRSRLRADRRRELGEDTAAIAFVRSPEETERSIRLWFDEARLFYERQTQPAPFRVVLRYHDDYADVVESFDYPDWAETSLLAPDDWLRRNVPVGQACALSRIDSDDSFANDYFEYLAEVRASRTDEPCLVAHRILRQYHLGRRELSVPMIYRKSLSFATILAPSFDPAMDLTGVTGHHHSYFRRPHMTPDRDYALQRITDRNAYNAWGARGWFRTLDGGAFRTESCGRYVGCDRDSVSNT